jgi:hypothetical protein
MQQRKYAENGKLAIGQHIRMERHTPGESCTRTDEPGNALPVKTALEASQTMVGCDNERETYVKSGVTGSNLKIVNTHTLCLPVCEKMSLTCSVTDQHDRETGVCSNRPCRQMLSQALSENKNYAPWKRLGSCTLHPLRRLRSKPGTNENTALTSNEYECARSRR